MKLVVFIMSVILLSGNIFADEKWREEDPYDLNGVVRESWYLYIAAGVGKLWYDTSLQDIMDEAKENPETHHYTLSGDLLGFYFHLLDNTIGGAVLNLDTDNFSDTKSTSVLTISNYTYSASVMQYFYDFATGPFLRADFGFNINSLNYSYNSDDDLTDDVYIHHYYTDSKYGYGFLVGTGWAINFDKARLLVNVNGAFRFVEDNKSQKLGITIGGLI